MIVNMQEEDACDPSGKNKYLRGRGTNVDISTYLYGNNSWSS
jgi:hypothetical protein